MLTPSINNFISLMDRVSGMEVNDTSIQELILDSYLKAFKASNSNKKTTANKRFKIFDDPNFKFYANPEMSDKAVSDFVASTTKADATVNQQVSSTPVAAPTTVLTMGKQQRTGVATFTIPGVKAETDAVAAVEAKTFGQANIDAIIAANPNTVFVGAGIAIKPGATSRNTTNYKASNTTVAQVGPASYGSIPYKYLPNVYKKDGTLIADSIMSDETYDQNIQVLEDAIQKIVENIGDKDVVFDANGYGQELLGRDPLNPNSMVLDKAPAPKTFVYLSKRLYEEFGFINPNSLGSNTIVNAVQTNQRVNELELFNTLKNEALSCSI
jgi:hypothetical protein